MYLLLGIKENSAANPVGGPAFWKVVVDAAPSQHVPITRRRAWRTLAKLDQTRNSFQPRLILRFCAWDETSKMLPGIIQ